MDDEASLLPRKLQAALEQALEQRTDIINQDSDSESDEGERAARPSVAAEADVSRPLISAAVAAATRLPSGSFAAGDAQSRVSHPAGESANVSNSAACVAQRVLLKLFKNEKL